MDDARKAIAPAIISAGKNPSGIDGKALAARRPLQPKPESPLTAVRLQIKAGGYDIIPVRDKIGFDGWPTQPNDEATIRRKWRGTGTAIRMYRHDVFVLDIDVGRAAVVKAILDAYTRRWPDFMRKCLRRHSGANTIALIGRCNTAKRRKQTARFLAESDAADSKGHLVEFFGRNDKRLTVVHGQHSEGRVYDYHGDPIWTRPVDSLPWFADADILTALDIAETIMTDHGLVRKENPTAHTGLHVSRVYDLEPNMVIELADDSAETLADLEDLVAAGVNWLGDPRDPKRLAGYANLWDPTSTTRDRVLIGYGSSGLCLYDTKFEISHRWKHRAPPPDVFGDKLKALLAQHQEEAGQS
jgi:hypothetical protein